MIERKIVGEKIKELQIEEYITNNLKNSGHSHTKIQRTPLGEKIIIFASRPGLIVGRRGQNIKKLTQDLKTKFSLENPQIEISEVDNPNIDAQIVSDRIAASLERYGSQRFKGIAHKVMMDTMSSGALGIEIVISGKVPGARAKSWRFYQGYLKKCGDIALTGVNKAHSSAKLKSGIIGIKVSVMPPTTKLPDDMKLREDIAGEVKDEGAKGNIVENKSEEANAKEKPKEKKTGRNAATSKSKKDSKEKKGKNNEKEIVQENIKEDETGGQEN